MHELSIAMSIVEMAQEEAELRGNVHIQAVHLRLGLLSGVVKDALLSSYEMACETTILEGSRLIIEEIPVEIYCANCRTHAPFIPFNISVAPNAAHRALR
jgi:hydrogenase nickel incorporation protein HypA/HybF